MTGARMALQRMEWMRNRVAKAAWFGLLAAVVFAPSSASAYTLVVDDFIVDHNLGGDVSFENTLSPDGTVSTMTGHIGTVTGAEWNAQQGSDFVEIRVEGRHFGIEQGMRVHLELELEVTMDGGGFNFAGSGVAIEFPANVAAVASDATFFTQTWTLHAVSPVFSVDGVEGIWNHRLLIGWGPFFDDDSMSMTLTKSVMYLEADPVPEPATLAALLPAALLMRRRRRKA